MVSWRVGGLFFHPELKKGKIPSLLFSGNTGLTLLLLGTLVIQIISFNNEVMKQDYPREVATAIEQELDPGEHVYVTNYEQVVYYLLEKESPTKYVHPNLIFTDTHKAFKINVDQEIKRIMDDSPEFIIVERENRKLNQYIEKKYKLMREWNDKKIRLYRLN